MQPACNKWYNWLRVLFEGCCEILNNKDGWSVQRKSTIVLGRFSTAFPTVEGFKARQIWVSVAETAKGIDNKEVSAGRNVGD